LITTAAFGDTSSDGGYSYYQELGIYTPETPTPAPKPPTKADTKAEKQELRVSADPAKPGREAAKKADKKQKLHIE
jgi:hypothetical protein